jgi:hypothetical protein
MYSQKGFSQASFLLSTKYFQNRIIMFCLELGYSVEKYNSTTDAASQLSEQGTTYFRTKL